MRDVLTLSLLPLRPGHLCTPPWDRMTGGLKNNSPLFLPSAFRGKNKIKQRVIARQHSWVLKSGRSNHSSCSTCGESFSTALMQRNELTVATTFPSSSPPPAAQLSVTTPSSHPHDSDWLFMPLLSVAKGRNVHMTYARSSAVPKNCNLGRIAAPPPKRGIAKDARCMHARARWVSATCGCQAAVTKCPGPVFLCVAAPPVVTACQSD